MLNKNECEKYIGKTILVGITYHSKDSDILERKQIYGTVIRINRKEGFVIKINNSDEEFKLPPTTEGIMEAKKGEYTLHSTGEVVTDPDFMWVWDSYLEKDKAD